MHQIRRRSAYRYVAWVLTVLLVLPYAASIGEVKAQVTGEVTSAVVLPIEVSRDISDPLLVQKITAAVALALEESGEFRYIAQADLQRELRELSLQPPLSRPEQLRVGRRLQADKVISGTLHELTVNRHTGQCRAGLELQSLDVQVEAVLGGAPVSIETKPIPGWEGDDVRVVNEGLREAAETAVAAMLRSRVPRGNVDLVDDQGIVTLNIGKRNGLYRGLQMLVKRGDWQPDLEIVKMRDVGVIEIDTAYARLSTGHSISGQTPRTGDKVYALYSPPEVVREQRHRRQVTGSLRLVGAFGMLLGLLAIGSSHGSTKAPDADVHLYQSRCGAQPFVRVNVQRNLDPEFIHCWLFFRGERAGFSAWPDNNNYLVGAMRGGRIKFFEDTAERQVGLSFAHSFTFLDRAGEEEDGTVDITYNHLALTPGARYYYKVRRVVDPLRVRIPTAQQIEEELEDVEFEVDPADALSEAGGPFGPVTYFQPAILSLPTNGSTTVNPNDVTFEWQPSVGAREYQVFVYDNANLNDPPVWQTSSPIPWTGQTVMRYRVTDFTFSGDELYYWVVGSRVAGEGAPRVRVAGRDKSGWVLSSIYNFQTVTMPPGPAAASAGHADQPARPKWPTGFWRERPVRPVPNR